MKDTRNKNLIKIFKESWDYLIVKKIHLTVEYMSSLSNQTAYCESQNLQDSSEWKLFLNIFKLICINLGKSLLDLFASRLCHQLPLYVAWQPNPQSVTIDAFQQDSKYQSLNVFPPFPMVGRILRQVQIYQINMVNVTCHV